MNRGAEIIYNSHAFVTRCHRFRFLLRFFFGARARRTARSNLFRTRSALQGASSPLRSQSATSPKSCRRSGSLIISWIERRYKIEAARFKARDETGIDWWGSDEVMVRTDDAKGSTGSNVIDDIDSGNTHHFSSAKSCILAVRPGEAVLARHRFAMMLGNLPH